MALPLSDVLIPFVHANDIAEMAATILLNDSYLGNIVEPTGHELINFKDDVEMIAKASNRSLNFYDITLQQYIERMKKLQIPSDVVWCG